MNWDDYRQRPGGDEANHSAWLRAVFGGSLPAPPPPVYIHRTPSPVTTYESLDHFLFLPDLHWNGRTVPE